jgi:exodeoxyribonuclease V alpha subunit
MSAESIGAGSLPGAMVQLASRIVRQCGERDGPDGSALVSACALALHQLSQGHTRVDLSEGGRVLLSPRDPRSGSDRIEVAVPPHIRDALSRAASRSSALVERMTASDVREAHAPLVVEGDHLSLARCRNDESALALALRRRAHEWDDAATRRADADRIASLEGTALLDGAQREAVLCSAARGLAIVTGGPGTGKTTVAARIAAAHAHIMSVRGSRSAIRLLAPTGKAASRLSASFASAAAALPEAHSGALRGCLATTVHAALQAREPDGLVRATMVIVDEASMVDLALMRQLVDAVPAGATLVVLGDRDQLASVEAGTVLADMTDSGSAIAQSVIRLERSHRFGGDSAVGTLARAVLDGDADRAMALLGDGTSSDAASTAPSGVRIIRCQSERDILHASLETFRTHGSEVAILCAHRHGATGTLELNRLFAEASGAPIADALSALHWDGRPVIVTENDRALGLMNGDVGVMRAGADGRIAAWFPGRDEGVPASILPSAESAYALTVHKSQGSEFDHVAVVLPAHPSPILTRELIFTGITRARRSVTLIGPPERVREAIGRQVARASGLSERLRIG